jgi:hypothetical protein
MNMPGFTADASIYVGTHRYTTISAGPLTNVTVQPQLIPRGAASVPPDFGMDIPPGHGGTLRPSPSLCDWNLFCCLEFGDQSCCRRWRLHCIPE